MPQNQERVVICAKVESTVGVDAIVGQEATSWAQDALLVSGFDISVDQQTIERENWSPSISADEIGTGMMLYKVTFKAELKSSGSFGVAPRIGRLLRACGFQETIIPNTAAATVGPAVAGPLNTTAANATIAGMTATTAATKNYDTYRITCTTGGALGTAKFTVTGAGFPDVETACAPSTATSYYTSSVAGLVTIGGTIRAPTIQFGGTWAVNDVVEVFALGVRFYYQVPAGGTSTTNIATAVAALIAADSRFTGTGSTTSTVTVTYVPAELATVSATATVVTLGSSDAQVTIPVFTGSAVAGDYWEVPIKRPGVRYDPVSDNVASLTIYAYQDGSLFRVTGLRGSAKITGEGGKYPIVEFTLTGNYNDPIDAALPTSGVAFENSKPYKVELANLQVFGMPNACAQQFNFDTGNVIYAKDCINSSEAYDEIRISDRTMTCGANPESTKPSVFNPWQFMRREGHTRMHVRVGYRGGAGNQVFLQADNCMFSAAPQQARNKILANDFQFRAARLNANGNNEVHFTFA